MNLLEETKEAIKNSGHTISDIIFIGSENKGYSCEWELFEILANRDYDESFGINQVEEDLIIVFSDGGKLLGVSMMDRNGGN